MEPGPYNQLWIHRLMLRDEVRTGAYKEAIEACDVKDAVVLDIGAGSGILSVLAARAGARKVYAVERTSIARFASALASRNGVSDRVEVIEDDIRNVRLPEPVDFIVSEWMGGYGIDENLLHPVLEARDRWLKEDGRMLPERLSAWIAPAQDPTLHADTRFWNRSPYGVDLSPITEFTAQEVHWTRHEVRQEDLRSAPHQMWDVDLDTFPVEDARGPFAARHTFTVDRPGACNSLATWFRAYFPGGIELTNAPDAPDTHWGRYVFPLSATLDLKTESRIEVAFSCQLEEEKDGYCHNTWSVCVDGGGWEHHDTRRALR